MEPFATLDAVAVPFVHPDVDTDELIPHRYLRKPLSAGYGNFLFYDKRFVSEGVEDPTFVLNRPDYRNARILVSGRNFGCGSTREGAVYALQDYGFRVVIAPSFSEIFYANCIQNGVLPITLDEAAVDDLARQLDARPGSTMQVDLAAQRVVFPDAGTHAFDIAPTVKAQLLAGLDEIGLTQQHGEAIAAFEAGYRARMPWLAPLLAR